MNPVYQRIETHIPLMEGWCTVEKAKDIANLIQTAKPWLCIEIGVFAGRSLIAAGFALEENKQGIIYGIDPWQKHASLEGSQAAENNEWWEKIDYEYFYKYSIDRIFEHGLSKICIPLRLKSDDACRIFPYNHIDIIHIDGNHSEEASCLDVQCWLPKLKPGGYVIFDDTNWSSTQKAVEMLKKECKITLDRESYAIFQKLSPSY